MVDIEAEEMAQLTNVQLLNVLHKLLIQSEFLTLEILKARLEIEGQRQKTPVKFRYFHKRVEEIDESFKGFITWFHSEEGIGFRKKQIVKQHKGIEV